MSDKQPRQSATSHEILLVWVKLVALLIGLSAFGGLIYWLSHMLTRH